MLIVGIALLIIGYFIALLTYDPSSSVPIFWFGFLMVLGSKQLDKPENYWVKGAKWGLYVNILMYIIISGWEYIWIEEFDHFWMNMRLFIYRPVTHILDIFFSPQYIHSFAERIAERAVNTTTLIIVTTYKLLDICFYISIGAIIGKFSIKKKEANPAFMLIIGIVVLIIGYLIGLRIQNPDSSTPIFWLGLLLILRSKQLANPENYWTKGAMLGLFGHALVYVILLIQWVGFLYYVYQPITYIAGKFFPTQYIILAVTYNLLNICLYLSIGAIIEKKFLKQKGAIWGKFSIKKKEANSAFMLIIGIVVLIIGYIIALKTQSPNPSIPTFWLGLLLVLRSKQLANPENYWTKGAMLGLFGHVLVYVILIYFGNILGLVYKVYAPITYIAGKFFPTQYIILAVTYNLLNICLYLSIGVIIEKKFLKQKGSQPINSADG